MSSLVLSGGIAFGFICTVWWFFIAEYFQEHSRKINILHSIIVFVAMSFLGVVLIELVS